jgi:hypothetical protein
MPGYDVGRQANLQRIIQTIQRGALPSIVAVNMTNSVAAALHALGDQLPEITQKLARELRLDTIPASRLRSANESIAHMAQQAIVDGWRSRLPVGAPGYRKGSDPDKDRLSGVLGQVLASPAMLRGTTDRTISFLNVGVLNTEARHWYRVNYGALGPIANPDRPESYPITAQGHTLFVLRDESPPASQSWLPKDWQSEGSRWFAPTAPGKADVAGGGHRSALFSDLGFQSVATNFMPTYNNMFNDYVDDLVAKAKSSGTGVSVHVTTDVRRGTRPTT